MKTYRTAEIAACIGVHPNTVRFYEAEGLLPPVPRDASGYRVFTDRHLVQLRLIRVAFRSEVLGSGLRGVAASVLRQAASGDLPAAIETAEEYRTGLQGELARAEEAVEIVGHWHAAAPRVQPDLTVLGRGAAARSLDITEETLRNWERNGLVAVWRNQDGYGIYDADVMARLKVIRALRGANYSTMAILRMLIRLTQGEADVRAAIDTPGKEEDIVLAADRYLSALREALQDAEEMLGMLRTDPSLSGQTLQ